MSFDAENSRPLLTQLQPRLFTSTRIHYPLGRDGFCSLQLEKSSSGYRGLDAVRVRLRHASLSEFPQFGPSASLLTSNFDMALMLVPLGHLNAVCVFVYEPLPNRERTLSTICRAARALRIICRNVATRGVCLRREVAAGGSGQTFCAVATIPRARAHRISHKPVALPDAGRVLRGL